MYTAALPCGLGSSEQTKEGGIYMKNRLNAGMRPALRRFLTLGLALLTLLGCMGTAFAEEAPKTPPRSRIPIRLTGSPITT